MTVISIITYLQLVYLQFVMTDTQMKL